MVDGDGDGDGNEVVTVMVRTSVRLTYNVTLMASCSECYLRLMSCNTRRWSFVEDSDVL